jgi:quercetin dioxygenase-like cupin family protein
MTAGHRVDFEALAWESLTPGARHKLVRDGDLVLRLVEFDCGFSEPDWCRHGHVGYVLSGQLDVEFEGALTHFSAGDGIVIPAGEGHRHKARVGACGVRLVLVERD